MKRKSEGFSLIELLVVIAVLVLFSVFSYNIFFDATEQSRDSERKAALKALQNAIELYKQDNGRYPEACNGPTSNIGAVTWSGQLGTDYECTVAPYAGTGEYIVGLAPDYIRRLPVDPKFDSGDVGYVYTVDPEGAVYKIMAMNTVESEDVYHGGLDTHEFYRCIRSVDIVANECVRVPPNPLGNTAYNTVGGTPVECTDQNIFENDYAVSGGYANGGFSGVYRETSRAREYFTEIIRCK